MRDLDQLPGPIVVCVPADFPAAFDDDVVGACALCGAGVRFRPHVPVERSIVCLLCFIVRCEPGQTCILAVDSLDELAMLAPDVPTC